MKKIILLSLCIAFLFASFTGGVFAAGTTDLQAALISDQDRPADAVTSDFRTAVVGFINYFLGFLGLAAVFFVIYAGVLMLTAQGEDEQVGKAKKILGYAGLGIIIILLSFAIVRLFIDVQTQVA